jgi:hypothetical protein
MFQLAWVLAETRSRRKNVCFLLSCPACLCVPGLAVVSVFGAVSPSFLCLTFRCLFVDLDQPALAPSGSFIEGGSRLPLLFRRDWGVGDRVSGGKDITAPGGPGRGDQASVFTRPPSLGNLSWRTVLVLTQSPQRR